MPTMTPVTLTDGSVDTVFAPRGKDTNGVASFVSSSGVPIADKRFTVQRSRVASSGREKVSLKMTIPVVQTHTENGISSPSVTRTSYADITFTFDQASTIEDRQQLRRWLGDLFGEPTIVSVVDNLEYFY